jgi:hypothetical protein
VHAARSVVLGVKKLINWTFYDHSSTEAAVLGGNGAVREVVQLMLNLGRRVQFQST